MKRTAISKYPIGFLGEYKSIFNGVEDPLEIDLIGQELRKNHRRSMKEIRRVVFFRYWMQVLRWTLEDIRVYVPVFMGITLGMILLFIALY